MMKLILASNNAHKYSEFRAMTEGLDIELISQREAGCDFEVDETGTTFEENSYLKAAAVTAVTGCAAVADDSGLVVDALDGAPGIFSARYGAPEVKTDAERYEYLLSQLGDEEKRSARFVSCICCTMPDGAVLRARGECEGEILFAPRGENGFGYDPVFRPDGYETSMAEITPDEKNAISHRGKALREFMNVLKEHINADNK